jgi:hypothetical protein
MALCPIYVAMEYAHHVLVLWSEAQCMSCCVQQRFGCVVFAGSGQQHRKQQQSSMQ